MLGDELFELLPANLREKYLSQPVVQSDLARLLVLRDRLQGGRYSRVVWCDADVLIFTDFDLGNERETFARECWVQLDKGRLRSYRKVHNAWMLFTARSSVLPFYIDRAIQLLAAAKAPVVPQLIGPKLLTAWHNISPFSVDERIGMLSPIVLRALLHNEADPLDLLHRGHTGSLCALNLSASCEGREVDGVRLDENDYLQAIDALRAGHLA
ncbi:MAG: hypothetical protein AAF671_03625 [Pseudomonadota bacterium]